MSGGFSSVAGVEQPFLAVLDVDFLGSIVDAISILNGAGGTQRFTLGPGPAFAGDVYLLLGSASGTAPGIPIESSLLPLNFDELLLISLTGANLPPYKNNLGFLGPLGTATASVSVPPSLSPSLAGIVIHHAYVVLELSGAVLLASNPVSLTLEL
jgi:hypothetical protein